MRIAVSARFFLQKLQGVFESVTEHATRPFSATVRLEQHTLATRTKLEEFSETTGSSFCQAHPKDAKRMDCGGFSTAFEE